MRGPDGSDCRAARSSRGGRGGRPPAHGQIGEPTRRLGGAGGRLRARCAATAEDPAEMQHDPIAEHRDERSGRIGVGDEQLERGAAEIEDREPSAVTDDRWEPVRTEPRGPARRERARAPTSSLSRARASRRSGRRRPRGASINPAISGPCAQSSVGTGSSERMNVARPRPTAAPRRARGRSPARSREPARAARRSATHRVNGTREDPLQIDALERARPAGAACRLPRRVSGRSSSGPSSRRTLRPAFA